MSASKKRRRRVVCPKTAMVGGKRRRVTATATTCSVALKSGKKKRVPSLGAKRPSASSHIARSAAARGLSVKQYRAKYGKGSKPYSRYKHQNSDYLPMHDRAAHVMADMGFPYIVESVDSRGATTSYPASSESEAQQRAAKDRSDGKTNVRVRRLSGRK